MSGENDNNLLNFIATTVEALRGRVDEISEQMATKVDIANLEDKITTLREQMATKDDLARVEASLRQDMATKNDLSRLEATMHGEFEQVHIRLDSLDRRVGTRFGQIETDVSRLRSVVYLLVKDKADMLRLLGQPTLSENPPQG
jgi:hypothetical protein